jgi:hypothetical protein
VGRRPVCSIPAKQNSPAAGVEHAAAYQEPGLSAIRCSCLFDLVVDILGVPVPDVELVARPPALHIRSSIEPCRDPLQSGSRIVRAAPKLHYHVQLVFLPASPAVATVSFDGFLDESVKEFVECVLPISGDDELASPLGEITTMFLLTESLLHLSDRT